MCRATRPKSDLIRIVRTPDGHVDLDPSGRRNGRGAYVCEDHRCWHEAVKGGILARQLRVLPDLPSLAELANRFSDLTEAHRQADLTRKDST